MTAAELLAMLAALLEEHPEAAELPIYVAEGLSATHVTYVELNTVSGEPAVIVQGF
jgi:hypothetical protein